MRLTILVCLLAGLPLGILAQNQVAQLNTDTIGQKVIADIVISGNDKTRERIILREMTIAVGDTLYWGNIKAALEQSRNNIMNLSLFNFVSAEPIQLGNNDILVLITVQERWYIYPLPILELAQQNFNTWLKDPDLRWLNYGVSVSHSNVLGLNQKLSLLARFGYTKRFSIGYNIPNLNRDQTLGLNLSAGYFENEQITYNTFENERLFYENPEEKAQKFYQYKVGLTYRENIFVKHLIELSYFDATVQDSVPILQPAYFTGGGNKSQFLRASYLLSYDTRDYRRYPLKGVLLYALLQQDGLGLVNKEGLGLFTTVASYRHHYKLAPRLYAAQAITLKANWDNPPYYLLNGLDFSSFVRGYELYVIDGTAYGLFQSNIKYELIQSKVIKLPFVKNEKFGKTFVALYGNFFFDAGYVDGDDFRANNSLVNEYLYGLGFGLDLVTYYDKVMRMEVNRNGLNEYGFRLAFKQSF